MASASKLPATIGSRYVPLRLLGKGGMGVVYEVEHARTGEHLALKVLISSAGASPEALVRFKREARAPAQIKSENVVRVSDADVAPELDGAPFLVMELLHGMDLEQAAAQSKPDKETAVGWLRQIAPALDKAHRLGIVHRDLKPENLFLATVEGRPPVVKILDFGIAKMTEEGSAATVSGQVLGTPKYMAPEQAARHPRVTPATDRYAIGLIAYRLLVGESYYRGNVMSILAELVHGAPSAPSARTPLLGEAFDVWFMKACHRDPEQRFASTSQQVEALAEALGLPFDPVDRPSNRWSGSARPLDGESGLVATTSSHRSLSQVLNTRRALTLGALLLIAVLVAIFYRPLKLVQPETGIAPSRSPTTQAIAPVSELTAAVAPPGQSAPEVAAATASVAASSTPVAVRPRTVPSRQQITVAQPAKAPARDPFQDQK
jgi:eukaryotic-like serine/threonine-protein kinase